MWLPFTVLWVLACCCFHFRTRWTAPGAGEQGTGFLITGVGIGAFCTLLLVIKGLPRLVEQSAALVSQILALS